MNLPKFEKRSWWQGLRFLAFSWTILPLTLMLILAIGATTLALQATLKTVAEDRDRTLAQLSADRLAENLNSYVLAMRVLAMQPDIANLNQPQIAPTFKAYEYLIADFMLDGGMMILDKNGLVFVTYPHRPELIGQNYSNQPYFKQFLTPVDTLATQDSPLFFDIVAEPGTERLLVGLTTPLIDDNGLFSGVLVGRFYLDIQQFAYFTHPLHQNKTQTQDQQQKRIAYVVDGTGRVIFHPDTQLIGQDFANESGVLALQQTNQSGAQVVQGADSTNQLLGYAPVQGTNWGLIIVEPWSQVMQPVQGALLFTGGTLILGVLGLTLIMLWVVQRITKRLDRLIVQTKQVAAGAYKTEVDLSHILEIRELGLAFNHMVRQISSYRAGLQEYVASVTESQEEERKRIARDLHDGTVQTLIAIGQRIELARDALSEQPLEKSKQQLTEVRVMAKEAIASVRQFSRDLRPLALEDLGLVPALQYLIGQLEQFEDITAELYIEGEATDLSQDLEITIYRIIQEALNNIRKHAQATQVFVTIRFLSRQTILEVQDDGIGFVVPEATTDLARGGSFGLLGLEERAHLFGGDISIQSALKQGTIVRVILPHEQFPRRRESRVDVDNA